MRISGRLFAKVLVYITYAVVITAVLLVVRFPHERLRHYLVQLIEQKLPETQCHIEKIGYQFPAGVKIDGLKVQLDSGSNDILSIDDITIQPELKNPISRFTMRLNAYEQQHGVKFKINWREQAVEIRNLSINQLDLGEFEYLHRRLGRELSGLMTVSARFSEGLNEEGAKAAKGQVTITDGEFSLLLPVLFQDVIQFRKIESDFDLNANVVAFENGRFNGNQLKGDFEGKVELFMQLTRARLNLKGKLTPKAEVLKNNSQATVEVNRLKRQFRGSAFPFVIQGEAGKPVFSFGN